MRVPSEASGRLSDAWRFCVGTGRFEPALRRDGVGVHQPYEYAGARHVRHSFAYVDQVIDAYLELGIKKSTLLGL
ncbi:hypothetical protein [Nonomuraea sp. NPDC050786]|uniref:hypothetical protein n=1 Tax=Nonomuraea sp. NPDC050786 TaxID=3154840 RepID=UPI0034088E66